MGCISTQLHEFLSSGNIKEIINNRNKTVIIHNLKETEKELTMNYNSIFGEVGEINNPFTLEFSPQKSINDVLWKLDIEEHHILSVPVKVLKKLIIG